MDRLEACRPHRPEAYLPNRPAR